MIEEILPESVAAAEAFTDPPGVELFPAEEAAIARAWDKRRREFTTARYCARLALARIGVPAAPIVPGERGAPGWPDGVVGSMTHCAGYRAAAVARATDVVTIGVDAEPNEPLPEGVEESVTGPAERAWLSRMDVHRPDVCWDRLVFSAKESVYKAWFPLPRRWLDFSEAVVTVDPPAGTFTARLTVPGPVVAGAPITAFTGTWLARDGLVLTSVVLTRVGPVG